MQTFLPYPDFEKSARCLDPSRLHNQCNEAAVILDALRGLNRWKNHPAVLMWAGHEEALKEYHNACLREWRRRGRHSTRRLMRRKTRWPLPRWFGNHRFHQAHRASLLKKNPDWYRRFGWRAIFTGYVWPVRKKR